MSNRWTRALLGGVVAAVAALYLASALDVGGGVAPNRYAGDRTWVIAHQGGEGLWPSNTMFAFERSVRLGVDMLETDLHATRDGVIVTMHDETVDRTTNGHGRVKDLTLARLARLDAGYRWTNDGGRTFPFRGRGVRVATLEELLAAFPQVPLTLEIKQDEPSIARPLCDALKRHGARDRVLIASFRASALREFREVCPGVATSMAEDEVRPVVLLSLVGLGGLARPAGDALQVPVRSGVIPVVTPALVAAAARKNVAVQAWTVNDPAQMRRLVTMGVDGIITDRPDLLREVLSRARRDP
ncbi:glycerophosphodiester phosphodiesterase [Deinococcus pimensis]|uniref:glycerophosphodiester phosphodiesterase n=1 Tax=Deinococcus pimensis TaxID=309888 RepID=UPI0004AEC273|nr:glycerophosphodiester phosphodiesterase [Deinococcus pimensis]